MVRVRCMRDRSRSEKVSAIVADAESICWTKLTGTLARWKVRLHLTVKAICHLTKDARTLEAKIIFENPEWLRLCVDGGEETELEQRSFQQIETAQRCLPSTDSIARSHVSSARSASFKGNSIGLRIHLTEATIDFFAHGGGFSKCPKNFQRAEWS